MKYDFDLVIIGAGSAGMTAAEVAAQMGVKAALVERARIGGDCLWTGCVPSKALLASARAAYAVRRAGNYGLEATLRPVDTQAVWRRLRSVQLEIAATDDSPGKFKRLGVEVIAGPAHFLRQHEVQVGERVLRARYALVCTGSRPAVPPIDGLTEAGYLTSENVFELARAPGSVVIIGGGPAGAEMAQAMARLDVQTTVLQRGPRILPRDEPELAEMLMAKLLSEGIDLQTGVAVTAVARTAEGKLVTGSSRRGEQKWTAEDVFVAAGRQPNVESLGLSAVGVKTGPQGIIVDGRLQTAANWVYAAGDCVGRHLFTHNAAAEAVTALRNMFFPGSAAPAAPVPWATFTEPELAHVGLTAEEARQKLGAQVRVFRWQLSHSDRARADGQAEGAIIAVTDSRFRILGAHILAPAAGEMIGQFTLAIKHRLRLTPDFGNLIQVYPTYSTGISQTAAEATYGQLQRPFLRALRGMTRFVRR